MFIKLYGLVVVSQFWLVANVLFTTSQARRLFGPIGVGLILGGICGGVVADTTVSVIGSENLLLGAAAMLVPGAGVVAYLGPRIRAGEAASGRLMEDISADAVKLLRDSSHLRTVALILGLTITVSTLIDWELNKAVELFVVGEDRMTAFWGRFFALQNVASVLIQALFTSWILQTLGVGAGLLALPLGLLVASVGVVALPALLMAAFAKGTEGALRYSLDQSTRELLYLPVPARAKYKVKPLIDLAVYRGGTGVAGVLLLACTALLGFSIREVALLCILVIAAWVSFALRMRSEFRDSVKRMIGIQDVELDELIVRRLDALTVKELRGELHGEDERGILYALSLLEQRPPPDIVGDVEPLIEHESASVRAGAVSLLSEVGTGERIARMRGLLRDPSLDVRAEVLQYLLEYGAAHPEDRRPALAALEEFGPEITDRLLGRLSDPETPFAIRRRLPALLRPHARQETVDRLVEILRRLESSQIRYETVKVLDKLRRSRRELDFDGYDIEPLVEREAREAYRWFVLWQRMDGPVAGPGSDGGRDGRRLLRHLLRQRHLEAVERALRTLALHYSLDDLYAAYTALLSPDAVVREQGFELLENVLSFTHRRLLDPLVDPGHPPEGKLELASSRYGYEWRGRREVLRELERDGDPWVAALALRLRKGQAGGGAADAEAGEETLRVETITADALTRHDLEQEKDMMKILDDAEFLQSTDLFSDLRTEDLTALAALMLERSHTAGEVIFREGDPDPGLHFVVEGEIVARREEAGATGAERRYGPGEPIGEIEALGGLPARSTARAATDARTLTLPRQDLMVALEERFGLVRKMLSRLAARCSELEARGTEPD